MNVATNMLVITARTMISDLGRVFKSVMAMSGKMFLASGNRSRTAKKRMKKYRVKN